MEIWDLFDENRKPLNKLQYREDSMTVGEYHTCVTVWTVNSRHEVLLTLRHPDKRDYANYWECTGGSVLAGETSKEGAARELFEETGINVNKEDLKYLGTIKEKSAFMDSYVVEKDMPVSQLKMQEGETTKAMWVSIELLEEMIKRREIPAPIINTYLAFRDNIKDFVYKT